VPGADTGDLAQTTMGLARQAGNTPTADDTGVSVTLRRRKRTETTKTAVSRLNIAAPRI